MHCTAAHMEQLACWPCAIPDMIAEDAQLGLPVGVVPGFLGRARRTVAAGTFDTMVQGWLARSARLSLKRALSSPHRCMAVDMQGVSNVM